jgi:hypothetical protein
VIINPEEDSQVLDYSIGSLMEVVESRTPNGI